MYIRGMIATPVTPGERSRRKLEPVLGMASARIP